MKRGRRLPPQPGPSTFNVCPCQPSSLITPWPVNPNFSPPNQPHPSPSSPTNVLTPSPHLTPSPPLTTLTPVIPQHTLLTPIFLPPSDQRQQPAEGCHQGLSGRSRIGDIRRGSTSCVRSYEGGSLPALHRGIAHSNAYKG